MTHKQRILIVDDEETILDLLSEALFADGYEVMTASNGACALDRMRETPPDLVLLDLYMPVMDGYEVLEKIRAEPAFKAIPVVILSGYHDREHVLKGLDLGADEYLPKPMQQWELRARLKALLALQRLRKRVTDLELLREQTLRHFCSQICSRLISPTRELEGYFRSRLAAWLPDEERRAAQGMFGHTTSLLSMLQSLSRYAHTDEQATEPLDLEEVILLAKGACESLWGAPHHEWVVKTQHPLPAVSGRRIDLNMAFCEIFTSALRSMVEGGRIEVQAGATGSAVRVEVKDTGHGIADDLQRSLVELFFPSPGHGARGLGMAVVKDIVERHEGTLSIESSPGVGTSVTVMLPVHKG